MTDWRASARAALKRPSAQQSTADILAELTAAGVDLAAIPDAKRTKPAPKARRYRPKNAAQVARRRTLGGDYRLPPQVRAMFSEGERATLVVIADQIKQRGLCDMPAGEIACRAGVSVSTVRNACREAKRIGLLSIEERRIAHNRNAPNIIRVIDAAWLTWIRRGPNRVVSKDNFGTDQKPLNTNMQKTIHSVVDNRQSRGGPMSVPVGAEIAAGRQGAFGGS